MLICVLIWGKGRGSWLGVGLGFAGAGCGSEVAEEFVLLAPVHLRGPFADALLVSPLFGHGQEMLKSSTGSEEEEEVDEGAVESCFLGLSWEFSSSLVSLEAVLARVAWGSRRPSRPGLQDCSPSRSPHW